MIFKTGTEKQISWATSILTDAVANINEQVAVYEKQITKFETKENPKETAIARNERRIEAIAHLNNMSGFLLSSEFNAGQIIDCRASLETLVSLPANLFKGHKVLFQG